MHKVISSIVLVCLLAVGAVAQMGEQKLEVRGFKGLNTVTTDLTRDPLDATILHNCDLWRKPGSITKRYGYDSVATFTAAAAGVRVDSMWIWCASYSDGKRQLFIVGAIHDSGYAGVWSVNEGTNKIGVADSSTRIYDVFGITQAPSFAIAKDVVYITNGINRGIICQRDGTGAREFPPRAPGQISVTPLTISGTLNGEYRYITNNYIHYNSGSIKSAWPKTATLPTVVKSSKVLLSGFDWPASDSVITAIDSVTIRIYRTLGNVGVPSASTQAYLVSSVTGIDSTEIAAYYVIDTMSDVTAVGKPSLVLLRDDKKGRDSLGVLTYYYGAPGYVSATDGNGAAANNIHAGWWGGTDTLGLTYWVSFSDSVTGMESNLSAPLNIMTDTGYDTIAAYTIGLPPIYGRDTGLVYNLYRAPLIRASHDTTFLASVDSTIYLGQGYWDCDCEYKVIDPEHEDCCVWVATNDITKITENWKTKILTDSIYYGAARLITQIPSDSSAWCDSVPIYTIENSAQMFPYFEAGALPGPIDNLLPHQSRLFAMYGSTVYWTEAGNHASWGAIRQMPVNESDGDKGTTMWVTKDAIRYYKNKSGYNIYPGTDAQYLSDWGIAGVEGSGYVGCVAPKSHAVGLGGHYFLSDLGVIRETEGTQLARTYDLGNVSEKLDNFTKMSTPTKKNAHAFYYDQKYMLCIGDTTYVYDERANAWYTWSLTFESATLFSTEAVGAFSPPDTMYFTKDSTLYRYGTSEYDNYRAGVDSTAISFSFKYGPFLMDGWYKQITAAGLWANTNDTGYDISTTIYNEEGTTSTAAVFTPLSQRYREKAIAPNYGHGFFVYGASSGAVGVMNTSVSIEGYDIFYTVDRKKERE